MIIMLVFAIIIPLGFGLFFLCRTIGEGGSFAEHLGNIFSTFIVFIFSGFLGLLVLVYSSQLVSILEPQTFVYEEQTIELKPVAKDYFLALTVNEDGDYVYNYAYMKDSDRVMGKAYSPRYVVLNENDEDIPYVVIKNMRYSDIFLRYMFLTESKYEFNIPTNSILNFGIPVI